MTRKQKKTLIRILISLVLLVAVWITDGFVTLQPAYLLLFLYGIPYLVIGYDVLRKAVLNIMHGQLFDENFLMAVATLGAVGTGEYREAVAVMLFYQVGELFQSYAVGKSRKSITGLMNIRPDYANIERNGALVQVDPEEISVGDTIIVKPGERIPLDGIILEGKTSVDTSALTGESVPRTLHAGDDVISGCVNESGLIKVKVTKPFDDSTVAKILDLVENSSSKKAKAENFITRFAKVYTPVVVCSAVLLAVLPPLVLRGDAVVWKNWIQRALTFLVISCPCALVISVPLSFFGGIGGASKCGILVKGGNYMEALAKTGIVVFDKTGTLTRGVFHVTALHPDTVSENALIELAAIAEYYSDHPIAISVKEAYGKDIDVSRITSAEEIAGKGVKAVIDGREVYVGNDKMMDKIGAEWHPCHKSAMGTTIHVTVGNTYAGHLIISDEVKPDAVAAVRDLQQENIRLVMLTGDTRAVGEAVAEQLGIGGVFTNLLPGDKVHKVEGLIDNKENNKTLAFVGDGINDAPALSRPDVGIAMGAIGSDAAIEAADVVLMDDQPTKIHTAIAISKNTVKLVKENIIFSLGVKLIVLILGALGIAGMWWAVFADVGVAVIAILNATRALNIKKY